MGGGDSDSDGSLLDDLSFIAKKPSKPLQDIFRDVSRVNAFAFRPHQPEPQPTEAAPSSRGNGSIGRSCVDLTDSPAPQLCEQFLAHVMAPVALLARSP